MTNPVKLDDSQLQKLITLFSVAVACQVIYIQHGWINDDSVLYFEIARLFSIGEWKEGIALFSWPLYPALISIVHQVTSLSIQTSAQVLDVLFFAITSFSFIHLIRLAGGHKTTLLCGAFLLFSSPYIVGDVLPMLLRDQGFWAAFTSSLVFFIRFYREYSWRYAILWQLCAITAVLFRIEAITYLAGLPLLLLFQQPLAVKQRLIHLTRATIIPSASLLLIICALLFMPSMRLDKLGRLQEVFTIFPRLATEVSQLFMFKAEIMNQQILGSLLDDYGLIGLIVTLVTIIILKVISLVSLPVAAIFALNRQSAAITSPPAMQKDARSILLFALILALLNAVVIISTVFVLSGRYIVAIGLIALLFAAFHLESLIKTVRDIAGYSNWKKIVLGFILALLALLFVRNLLPKHAGYNFEQDAVAYAKQHDIPNSSIFFVTPRSRYYADAPYTGRGHNYWDYTVKAIEQGSIYQFDYLMLNVDVDRDYPAKEKLLKEKLPQYQLIEEFYGLRKKKKVMFFKKMS